MPGGKTHAIGTAIAAVALYAIADYVDITPAQSALLSCGALATLWVHPDLDQAETRMSPWHILWWPYGMLVKHRSWISHFPIISTAIRAIYLGSILGAIYYFLSARILIPIPNLPWEYGLIGMALADWVHIVLDFVSTSMKKSFGGNDADLHLQMRRARQRGSGSRYARREE